MKLRANVATLLTALKECRWLKDLNRLKALHAAAEGSGHISNIYIANALLEMYIKCGSMGQAHRFFDGMVLRDVASWTLLMTGYADSGEGQIALDMFTTLQGQRGCVPDARMYLAALKACMSLLPVEDAQNSVLDSGVLERGRAIYAQAANCGCNDLFVENTMIDLYVKCSHMQQARQLFDTMRHRDVVSWNVLIFGYVENGEEDVALQLFACMPAQGICPDARSFLGALKALSSLAEKEEDKTREHGSRIVKLKCLEKGKFLHRQAANCGYCSQIHVGNALIDMYSKCGSLEDARISFDCMRRRDAVSWTSMILGYTENGEGDRALKLFASMRTEGCQMDSLTYVAALKACGSIVALESGRAIYAEACLRGLGKEPLVENALIDFYGKCGCMAEAQQVFDLHSSRNLVSWNTLLTGYSRQGNTSEVFHVFQRMKDAGFQPNSITFIGLLTACSHSGLIDQGKNYFDSMLTKHDIRPQIEHYICMVDMLGRGNHLESAVSVATSMPFEANTITWMTILAACRKWKSVEVGKLAFRKLIGLDPKDSTPYVLMAKLYAALGMRQEQANVASMRHAAGAWKKPGQSWWSDESGCVHAFHAEDIFI